MTSSISWLDFDSRAHERSQQLLATLNEPGTRDELGLGNIRDALSDLMFPGTSTIQTRLKYMLLVPWTYAWLESRQVPARAFARRAHQMEVRLIETLSDSGQRGIIGSGARGSLKRMPSSIYWAGLRSWGLRLFDGSQTNYYNSIDRIHASRKAMERQRKEHGSAPLDATSTWHAFFRNEQWLNTPLKEQTIALSFNEAEFLRDRIYATQPGTYLKWLAELNEPDESDFPWTQFRAAELPPDITRLVGFELTLKEHSIRFGLELLLHGAPGDRDAAILRAFIQNRAAFMRYLLLLLSEFGNRLPLRGLPGPTGSGTSSSNGLSPDMPMFEQMARAFARDPASLDSVARVMAKLDSDGHNDVVPDDFRALWQVFEKVLEQEGRP